MQNNSVYLIIIFTSDNIYYVKSVSEKTRVAHCFY